MAEQSSSSSMWPAQAMVGMLALAPGCRYRSAGAEGTWRTSRQERRRRRRKENRPQPPPPSSPSPKPKLGTPIGKVMGSMRKPVMKDRQWSHDERRRVLSDRATSWPRALCRNKRCIGCRPASEGGSRQYNRVCFRYMLRCIAERVDEILKNNERARHGQGATPIRNEEHRRVCEAFAQDPWKFFSEYPHGVTFHRVPQILMDNFKDHFHVDDFWDQDAPGPAYTQNAHGMQVITERQSKWRHIWAVFVNMRVLEKCHLAQRADANAAAAAPSSGATLLKIMSDIDEIADSDTPVGTTSSSLRHLERAVTELRMD